MIKHEANCELLSLEDLDEYRPLDPSRCGSPTNDDIVTARQGQVLLRGRQSREASLVIVGVSDPDGVFNNTREARSRSSSSAPEACNGSDASETETKSKKAKDTKQSSKPFSASEAKTDDGEHREKK